MNAAFEGGFDLWFSYALPMLNIPTAIRMRMVRVDEKGDPMINSPEHQLNHRSVRLQLAECPADRRGCGYTDERAVRHRTSLCLTTFAFFGQYDQPAALHFDLDNAFDGTTPTLC